MEIAIKGKVSEDPKTRILALEAVTKSICQQTGQDTAEGTMMLLTAAVHISMTHSRVPVAQMGIRLAECLGCAIVAADEFFNLREIVNANLEAEEPK